MPQSQGQPRGGEYPRGSCFSGQPHLGNALTYLPLARGMCKDCFPFRINPCEGSTDRGPVLGTPPRMQGIACVCDRSPLGWGHPRIPGSTFGVFANLLEKLA